MNIKENISLAKFSRIKIGGPAKYFADAKNIKDLKFALKFARQKKLRVLFMGEATNLLISDNGFDGIVIRYSENKVSVRGRKVTVSAGVTVGKLLSVLVKNNLSGMEWAGGLPGTIGGAVFGNAGAFGGETKDSVESVSSISFKTGEIKKRDMRECRFGYRNSTFKEHAGEEIIVQITLRLNKGKASDIRKVIKKNIEFRKERHPMDYPNLGSVFKNVPLGTFAKANRMSEAAVRTKFLVKDDPEPVIPAAHLIGKLGVKGVSFGGAMVSLKHANFIVNSLGASENDISTLITLVKSRVAEEFGVNLEEEIRRVRES